MKKKCECQNLKNGSVIQLDKNGCCSFCKKKYPSLNAIFENPKEATGATKTPYHLVPARVEEEIAWAMKEGADKYGAYNYRKAGVIYSTYYSSTRRHLKAWFEGEDIDPDSGINHIVKAIAGLIVLRDSMLENNATDDRPNEIK